MSRAELLDGVGGVTEALDYDYDGAGNRVERRIDGVAETYGYDGLSNRLLSVLAGGVTRSFTYGNTGNVTLDDRVSSAMTLTYNSMDRLVRISAGSGPGAIPLADYVYAANGQRVAKITPAGTTHYLYEPGGALFAETDGAGAVLREYVTLGGATLAVIDGGFINFVHGDHLSTAQKMTDGSGAVVWDASYRPFGEATVTAAAGAINEQRFPGQYADAESGYHDNWWRSYDPSLGRYLQSDPIGLAGGLNIYAYAGGNPVMNLDPLGLGWQEWGPPALAVGSFITVVIFAPEIFVVASVAITIGTVTGVVGLIGIQYATGGWCAVDKELLWMLAKEAAWTVVGATALKYGFKVLVLMKPKLIKKFLKDESGGVPLSGSSGGAGGGPNKPPFAMGKSDGLDDFAKQKGATTYEDFDDPLDWQRGVMDKLADPNQKVIINLDGVDPWAGVQRAAVGRGAPMDWELLQVKNNPGFWDSIEWWKNGLPTGNPFQ